MAFFQAQNQLLNFNFFEIVLTAAQTNQGQLAHNLGFIPKDVIVTQITGSGTFNFLFGQFDATNIYYTSTGACRVRFFVGTYWNDQSTAAVKNTDIMSVLSAG